MTAIGTEYPDPCLGKVRFESDDSAMVIFMGFVFGLLAMLSFGLYALPRKLTATGQFDFPFSMCSEVGLTTKIIGTLCISEWEITSREIAFSLLSGGIWYMGTLLWVKAIDCIGYSRSTSIKNTTGVFAIFIGIFFLTNIFQKVSSLGLT